MRDASRPRARENVLDTHGDECFAKDVLGFVAGLRL